MFDIQGIRANVHMKGKDRRSDTWNQKLGIRNFIRD